MNDSAGIAAAETTARQRLRAIFGGSVGNLIEWYDWYTYAAFAIYFAPSFFPESDSTVQLLNTAAIFAVGFLMRPIGGWVLGRYADRHGRKAALTLSVTLMCLGSLIIAVTPTYQTIGAAAPALLLIARLLQGFSVGGEYGTSATYMSEIATKGSRGFYSGILYVTLIMGQLLALAVLMVLQFFVLEAHQLESWGWRIPFAIGAAAALAALYLRRNLVETEAFKKKAETAEAGQLTLLLRHPREVLIVIGLTMGGTLFFYTFTTYMQKFLVNTVGLSKGESTLVSTANLFIFMLLQPLMGALSDRYGRRPMLIVFGVLALFGTVPLLSALSQAHDAWTAFFLIFVALAISSLYSSISAVVKAELFPVEIRALGVGLPYAITVSLFGGTAEMIALSFKNIGHEELFYWYVTACVFVSLLVYIFMREPQRESLI
ncbi:MFS dicarboxylate transporter [Steroidobacter agaridevorans]|uniref:MFS dicarboxylate transporter n=1 Tax=Steroidobacter agaridevorans TaxID=2695856 RepID=A0A829YDL0_9GAMM|nr:MFS transporter [Steroidobacter agaridevorans]GFE80762.1 MFS dicarboxylate transporter [Steroidobacter agaridevorans]GFE87863.1 MFS dicarboxylate transporter [Steroidobacter agaridevorans]